MEEESSPSFDVLCAGPSAYMDMPWHKTNLTPSSWVMGRGYVELRHLGSGAALAPLKCLRAVLGTLMSDSVWPTSPYLKTVVRD